MKQVVISVPVVGYAEYLVEVEDDLSLDEIVEQAIEGEIHLPYDPKTLPIVDWALVDDLALWRSQIPNEWPTEVEADLA